MPTCDDGWHARPDFLRFWTDDGSGTMYFRYLSRLRDKNGTYMYMVGAEPVETNFRKVWCYADEGRPWRCLSCGRQITG